MSARDFLTNIALISFVMAIGALIETMIPMFVAAPHIHQSAALRSRNAFPITETELNVMAALAIIGLSNTPSHG